jgi:hypothetical protein
MRVTALKGEYSERWNGRRKSVAKIGGELLREIDEE